MPTSKRDQLVQTAMKLFVRDGYHATGIDTILAEAGVAKMTLYKHFKSKDELILAVLELRDRQWRDWFAATVEELADDPRDRLLAMFDALKQWFEEPDFSGCAFVKACNEFADTDHQAHIAAAEHGRHMAQYVRDLVRDAGINPPEALTAQLVMLMQGAILGAQFQGCSDCADNAKQAADVLITASIAADSASPA